MAPGDQNYRRFLSRDTYITGGSLSDIPWPFIIRIFNLTEYSIYIEQYNNCITNYFMWTLDTQHYHVFE